MRALPRSLPGNTLLVVMVAMFLVGASAVTVLFMSQNSRLAALRSEGTNIADANAWSGLQRAVAHLDQFDLEGELDLDRALDPALTAACDDISDKGLPVWTDADIFAGFLGRSWTRVAFNGGAYLVRFDDDDDDATMSADIEDLLVNSTDNNNTAAGCNEGDNNNNADRDRNGAVYITAVGLAGSTDPATARDVRVIRQLYTRGPVPTGGIRGVTMNGDMITNGNAQFLGCSPIAGVDLEGDLDGNSNSSRSCLPGDSNVLSINNPQKWSHCTSNVTAPLTCQSLGIQPSVGQIREAVVTNPPVEPVNSPRGTHLYFDFARPCTFYMDQRDNGVAIWFWDAHAPRGPNGAICGDYDPLTEPDATRNSIQEITPPDLGANNWERCWTPLVVSVDDAETLVLEDEVADGDTDSEILTVGRTVSPWGHSSMPHAVRALADEDCNRDYALDDVTRTNLFDADARLAIASRGSSAVTGNRKFLTHANDRMGVAIDHANLFGLPVGAAPPNTLLENFYEDDNVSTPGGPAGRTTVNAGGWCPIGGVAFPVPGIVDVAGVPTEVELHSMETPLGSIVGNDVRVDELGVTDPLETVAPPGVPSRPPIFRQLVNPVDRNDIPDAQTPTGLHTIRFGERVVTYTAAPDRTILAGPATIELREGTAAFHHFEAVLAMMAQAGVDGMTVPDPTGIPVGDSRYFKPDWAAECLLAYPPDYSVDPPVAERLLGCTECDGTKRIVYQEESGGVDQLFWDFASRSDTAAAVGTFGRRNTRGQAAGTVVATARTRISAVPPGVWYWDAEDSERIRTKNAMGWEAGIVNFGPANNDRPDDPDALGRYPPISIVSSRNRIDFQSGNSAFWFGVGFSGAHAKDYGNALDPLLLVPTNDFDNDGLLDNPAVEVFYPTFANDDDMTFDGNAGLAIGGSYYAQGDFDWNGGSTLHHYGEVHVTGSLLLGGGGDYIWKYQRALQPPQNSATRGTLAPTLSRGN